MGGREGQVRCHGLSLSMTKGDYLFHDKRGLDMQFPTVHAVPLPCRDRRGQLLRASGRSPLAVPRAFSVCTLPRLPAPTVRCTAVSLRLALWAAWPAATATATNRRPCAPPTATPWRGLPPRTLGGLSRHTTTRHHCTVPTTSASTASRCVRRGWRDRAAKDGRGTIGGAGLQEQPREACPLLSTASNKQQTKINAHRWPPARKRMRTILRRARSRTLVRLEWAGGPGFTRGWGPRRESRELCVCRESWDQRGCGFLSPPHRRLMPITPTLNTRAPAGEKAVRRDPRSNVYTGIACPDMKKVRPFFRRKVGAAGRGKAQKAPERQLGGGRRRPPTHTRAPRPCPNPLTPPPP